MAPNVLKGVSYPTPCLRYRQSSRFVVVMNQQLSAKSVEIEAMAGLGIQVGCRDVQVTCYDELCKDAVYYLVKTAIFG